jgi:hypothetical protein
MSEQFKATLTVNAAHDLPNTVAHRPYADPPDADLAAMQRVSLASVCRFLCG